MREHREPRDSVGVLAVAPAEAARLTGVGRTTIYEAIGAGALKSVKDRQAPADHDRSAEGVAARARGCRVTTSPAAALAQALGGRRTGSTWMARCPAHDDREPSLSISSGDGWQGARALPCRLRSARRDRRASRARRLARRPAKASPDCCARPSASRQPKPDADALKRTRAALAIWQASQPAEGTPVETYLRSRGLDLRRLPCSAFMPG